LYQAEIILDLSVKIADFHIPADQVGLAPPPDDHTNAEIVHEFATMVAKQHHNSCQGFEKHQGCRIQSYSRALTSQNHHFKSGLKFSGRKRRCGHSPTPIRHSPSPALSYVSESHEGEQEYVGEETPPPEDKVIEMETTSA
jgi:hypothetical protein